MSEQELQQKEETPAPQASTPEVITPIETQDPVRKITKYILVITALIFIWYIIADRHAPWSDQARVQTYVIPIVPQVSGRVTEVLVKQDQIVAAGDDII